MDSFHAMVELKQTALIQILMLPILIIKLGLSNRQIGLPLNNSFFECQNDHHLGDAINFGYVSSPFSLHF